MSENMEMMSAEQIAALGVNGTTYCSFEAETMADKVKFYNAINSPKYKLSDMINKPLYMVDAIITGVSINDMNTGEVRDAARSTIIDKDGNSYSATSSGIMNSLRNIMLVFGTLHFDEPLKITVNQVNTKNGNTLSLSIM